MNLLKVSTQALHVAERFPTDLTGSQARMYLAMVAERGDTTIAFSTDVASVPIWKAKRRSRLVL